MTSQVELNKESQQSEENNEQSSLEISTEFGLKDGIIQSLNNL